MYRLQDSEVSCRGNCCANISDIFPSTGLRELHREALNKCPSLSCVTHFIGFLADVVLAEAEKWPSQRRYGESYRWDSREFPRNIPQVSYPSGSSCESRGWLRSREHARDVVLRFARAEETGDIARILLFERNGKSSPINGVHISRVWTNVILFEETWRRSARNFRYSVINMKERESSSNM